MNNKNRMELKRKVLASYKDMMKSLYVEFGREGINSDEIRIETLRILTCHVLTQTQARLNRKTRKQRKVKVELTEAMKDFLEPI